MVLLPRNGIASSAGSSRLAMLTSSATLSSTTTTFDWSNQRLLRLIKAGTRCFLCACPARWLADNSATPRHGLIYARYRPARTRAPAGRPVGPPAGRTTVERSSNLCLHVSPLISHIVNAVGDDRLPRAKTAADLHLTRPSLCCRLSTVRSVNDPRITAAFILKPNTNEQNRTCKPMIEMLKSSSSSS